MPFILTDFSEDDFKRLGKQFANNKEKNTYIADKEREIQTLIRERMDYANEQRNAQRKLERYYAKGGNPNNYEAQVLIKLVEQKREERIAVSYSIDTARNNIKYAKGEDYYINIKGHRSFRVKKSSLDKRVNPMLYILERNIELIKKDIRDRKNLPKTKRNNNISRGLRIQMQKNLAALQQITSGMSIAQIIKSNPKTYRDLKKHLQKQKDKSKKRTTRSKRIEEYPLFLDFNIASQSIGLI